MDDELEPCPICGSNVDMHDLETTFEHEYWIECPRCHCSTEHAVNKEELVTNWNKHRPRERKHVLAKCPLCGGSNVHVWHNPICGKYSIQCGDHDEDMCCGFSTPWMDTEEEAISLWNAGEIEEDEK